MGSIACGRVRSKLERCSWFRRACVIFLRKTSVVHSLFRACVTHPSLLGLRKNLLRNRFFPNCIGRGKSRSEQTGFCRRVVQRLVPLLRARNPENRPAETEPHRVANDLNRVHLCIAAEEVFFDVAR